MICFRTKKKYNDENKKHMDLRGQFIFLGHFIKKSFDKKCFIYQNLLYVSLTFEDY